MACVTDSNRPQPLPQPPPTACLTAYGAPLKFLPFQRTPASPPAPTPPPLWTPTPHPAPPKPACAHATRPQARALLDTAGDIWMGDPAFPRPAPVAFLVPLFYTAEACHAGAWGRTLAMTFSPDSSYLLLLTLWKTALMQDYKALLLRVRDGALVARHDAIFPWPALQGDEGSVDGTSTLGPGAVAAQFSADSAWYVVWTAGGAEGLGGKVLGRSSELQRNRDPYVSLAASLPARGVTDTLAPTTLRSDPPGIRTEHL